MNKKIKRALLGIMSAVILVTASNTMLFAASSGYSGTVKKYSDFESGTLKKANKTKSATNKATTKPSGAFSCWIEVSKTGSNASYKTSYTSTGTYNMAYKQNLDSPDSCAENLYIGGYNLKLNISTTLTNFTSGTVKGTWSPDKL